MNIFGPDSVYYKERISSSMKFSAKANRLAIIRFLLCVVVVTILAVVRVWLWKSIFYNNVFIFYCATVSLAWMVLEGRISGLLLKAARFLQFAECDLFGIEWNHYLCGRKPLPEDVYQHHKKKLGNVDHRYPTEISKMEKSKFVLAAFRMNVIRELDKVKKLRRNAMVIFCLAIVAIVVSSILVTASNTNALLLYIIVPAVPVVVWFASLLQKTQSSQEQLHMIDDIIIEASQSNNSNIHNFIQDYFFLYHKSKYPM